MNQRSTRPLDSLYPVILIDVVVVKIRDQAVENRPIYVVMDINLDGERDILGSYPGPAGSSEGAKYLLTVLTELKNQGVSDALVACCDCENDGVLFRLAAWSGARFSQWVVAES